MNKMTKKKVLVTGAAGFIGSHVAQELLNQGLDVVAVDDLSGGFLGNLPEGARFVQMDVADHVAVDGLFEKEGRFDVIYHLAAFAAEGLSHYIRRYNYTNNVIGSINLINQAVKTEADCFVFTSSIAVYGSNQVPMTEDLAPSPEDPYGVAKFAVELDLRAAKEQFGLDYVVFRPHNVYGERQNIADHYRNVIGIFMNQILQGQPLTVFGDGLQTRAFSYITDVAPVIANAPNVPEARNQIFNVGADQPYTVLELASEIAKALGASPEITHLPARNEVVHAYATHEKAQRVFGQGSPVSLAEGIEKMAVWVRSVGMRPSVGYEGLEITKNFPEGWKQYLQTEAVL
jgi:UDP-glucose 4-epimerase